MNRSAAHTTGSADSGNGDERFDIRVLAVRCAADRQELTLRKSTIQCGGKNDTRFDLVYQRYNQPVAYDLTLTEVEVWLGLRR